MTASTPASLHAELRRASNSPWRSTSSSGRSPTVSPISRLRCCCSWASAGSTRRGSWRTPQGRPASVRPRRSPATTAPHHCRCGPRTTNDTVSARAGNRQLNSAIHIAALTQIRCHPGARDLYRRRIQQGNGTMEALRIVKRRISDAVSAPWPPTRTSKFAPPLDRRATHRTTPRSPARHVRNGRSVLHEPSRSGNDLNGFSVVSSSITPHEARGRRGGCCRRHHCRHDLAR